MIIGAAHYSKSRPWAKNPHGARSLEEAISLARQWGVAIPEDVEFYVGEDSSIDDPNVEASYFAYDATGDAEITWSQIRNIRGNFAIRIRQRVLESDEAIVAVFAHEIYEIERLRQLFAANGGRLTVRTRGELVASNVPGNLHDRAWEAADQLVQRMRASS